MKKIILLLILMVAGTSLNASPILRTLSGKVEGISKEADLVQVKFFHPGTEEYKTFDFHVNEKTGLKGFEHLNQLEEQAPVQVDYIHLDGRKVIKRLTLVPLEGVPEDLKNFNGLSLFKKK